MVDKEGEKLGIFGITKKEETKKPDQRQKEINRLEEEVKVIETTMDEYKASHEKMKAMKTKEFLEKYVTRIIITDLRDNKTILDTDDSDTTIDKDSTDNWLYCTDTELKVNFKEGYELTLQIKKEGGC